MTFPLSGSTALITGAANGIGAALAEALARQGCALALIDVDAAALAQVARHLRACADVSEHALDLRDAQAIAALPKEILARHGRLNLLVNNAGAGMIGLFEQVTIAEMENIMAINFWAAVRLCSAFLPMLRREHAAHIVNVSSVLGLIGAPGQLPYSASKFALRGFSEALRMELAGSTVGVTTVFPGGVATGIAKRAHVAAGTDGIKAQAQASRYERALRTSPRAAAAHIVKAIQKREPRVLIGADAKVVDRVQRLFPERYARILRMPAS